ncbi:protein NATD1 isoform X2 [Amblyomma americanum]
MLVCAAMSSSASFQVEHDKANREFFIKFGKEVPESLRGKGIAKHLAKAALEYVAGKDLQAKITCPYVGKFAQTDAAKAAFDYLVSEDLRATLSCTYLVKYWNEAQNPEYRRRVVT